jgi:aminocarboxymuconate-semialdehyde decarboxylase
VLYLHPAGNSACTPLIKDFSLTWVVGAPVEDATCWLDGLPLAQEQGRLLQVKGEWNGGVR